MVENKCPLFMNVFILFGWLGLSGAATTTAHKVSNLVLSCRVSIKINLLDRLFLIISFFRF